MRSIKIYQQNQSYAMNTPLFIASLLEKAAVYLEHACQAIEDKDYEKRSYWSTLATQILQGLHDYAPEVHEKQPEVAENLRNYYSDMTILILRMNVKNDLKTAASLLHSLRDIAGAWRALSDEAQTSLEPEQITD